MTSLFEQLLRSLLCVALLIGAAHAQQSAYPSKSIRFILPFPPGGPTDLLGRIIAQKLADQLGQPVVADNRGGAGGNLGVGLAAKSPPDGYTVVLSSPLIALGPSLYVKLEYDPVKDLALAVLSAQRERTVPNVPTAKEAGVDNFEVPIWYGILAPAGTPRDIINRLNLELNKVVTAPDVRERLTTAGVEPMTNTPEQFANFIKSETVRYAKVIKDAGIKPE